VPDVVQALSQRVPLAVRELQPEPGVVGVPREDERLTLGGLGAPKSTKCPVDHVPPSAALDLDPGVGDGSTPFPQRDAAMDGYGLRVPHLVVHRRFVAAIAPAEVGVLGHRL